MCVAFVAWHADPRSPLILAHNRDEFYSRPTDPASVWADAPGILAGRDRKDGGTWLGVSREGRIAFVTNIRDPHARQEGARSRGALVRRFLEGEPLAALMAEAAHYNPFNLVAGDAVGLWYASTRAPAPIALAPGIHAVSNGPLGAPWPKVVDGAARFRAVLAAPGDPVTALLGLMGDAGRAPDDRLPRTGVPLETERQLSPIFVATPTYGTRATTIVTMGPGARWQFVEKTRGDDGAWRESRHTLDVRPPA